MDQIRKNGFGFFEVFGVVVEEGSLGLEIMGSREGFGEFGDVAVDVGRGLVQRLVGV